MITVSSGLAGRWAPTTVTASRMWLSEYSFAERRRHEVIELLPEQPDVDRLRHDQAKVQRQLQPAAAKMKRQRRKRGLVRAHRDFGWD
jgi:hypothetical protein